MTVFVLLALQGRLVIVGGGDVTDDLTKAMLEKSAERVVIVTNAADAPAKAGELAERRFRSSGAKAVDVVDLRLTKDADAAPKLRGAPVIYFSGGDQNRLTKALEGTETLKAIREAFEKGATVGGTSAGAAVMSDPMITGEGDWGTLTNGAVKTAPGFGLLPGVIVDQHFVREKRANRLLSLVIENPKLVGVGIDESTGIVVDGRSFKVMGKGCVIVMDARKAKTASEKDKPQAASDIVLHVLKAGDAFDLGDR